MDELIHRHAEVSLCQQQISEQLATGLAQTEQEIVHLQGEAAESARTPEVRRPAHQVLTNLTEQDDVDDVHTFELVAARKG